MIWDVQELFNSIVTFEKNVGKLYDNIADDVKKKFGPFFENMAKDEYRHAKIYEALAKKAAEKNMKLDNPDEASYLQSLAENNFFNSEKDYLAEASKIRSKFQILDLAEKVEREALQYIYELMRVFPDFAKDEVAILLKEEKKHLQMVLDRKKEADTAFLGL